MKEIKDDYCEDLEFCLKEKKYILLKKKFNCKKILNPIYLFPKFVFVFSCQFMFFYQ
jgi:hypothetical protein